MFLFHHELGIAVKLGLDCSVNWKENASSEWRNMVAVVKVLRGWRVSCCSKRVWTCTQTSKGVNSTMGAANRGSASTAEHQMACSYEDDLKNSLMVAWSVSRPGNQLLLTFRGLLVFISDNRMFVSCC
jgi:hypothetical protein